MIVGRPSRRLTTVGVIASLAATLRVWFNGRTKASQALSGGSIPLTRSSIGIRQTRLSSAGFVRLFQFGFAHFGVRGLIAAFLSGLANSFLTELRPAKSFHNSDRHEKAKRR